MNWRQRHQRAQHDKNKLTAFWIVHEWLQAHEDSILPISSRTVADLEARIVDEIDHLTGGVAPNPSPPSDTKPE